MGPVPSTADLIRYGFARLGPTKQLCEQYPDIAQIIEEIGRTADPDLTLLQLVRLKEAGVEVGQIPTIAAPDPWNRFLNLLGGSRALGDYLIAHAPQGIQLAPVSDSPRSELLAAVGANAEDERPVSVREEAEAVDSLRLRYRQLLIDIAADDLTVEDPLSTVGQVGARLAQLADGAVEAALAIARSVHDPEAQVEFSVIALGKTGARELNYISDVDIMFLAGSADDLTVAADLARSLASYCSGPGNEPPLWTLDAGLRPEGRDGALVRTVASTLEYYRKWAQNWEFQALLKARAAAGSVDLAEEFLGAVEPLVWSAASRPGFVSGAQKMRTQVEASVRRADIERELKLSAGGLRDVEFTVQLLQLVHGQTDPAVRIPNTLEAIEALARGGYVGRAHALELTEAYRFLRLVEHRVQLQNMRRTHTLPSSKEAIRALARSIDPRAFPSYDLFEDYLATLRKRVRELHEDVYYRPIVAATATLGEDQSALDAEAAEERLRAIGYVDPVGALRSIAALTKGTSRRAMIQRNLSPVIIQWLSEGVDPDMGMLSFRTLSEQIGSSHWYLSLLRDSSSAAWRLCQVLSNSRWAEGALSAIPEAIAWLDSDRLLNPVPQQQLLDEAAALMGRHEGTEAAMGRVSALVAREVTRAGLSDATAGVEPWRPAMSEVVDVAVRSALTLALRERRATAGVDEVRMAVVGMGRYGGRENSYASDIDLLFVHQPAGGVSEVVANAAAAAVGNRVKELLQQHRQEGMISTDLDLRPEGRQGAISRTVESYQEYYRRWASTWERHALVRARVVGGDEELGRTFGELIDSWRWHRELTQSEIREIRLLKARMENERLPRGAQPAMHVKLGPGGLTDVEWTVQLLQLRHADTLPALQVESTLVALDALVHHDLLSEDEGQDLRRAWDLASRVRAANVLASGRLQPERVDTLPRQPHQGRPVAALLGYGSDGESELVEQWMFASRRARAVMETQFWD